MLTDSRFVQLAKKVDTKQFEMPLYEEDMTQTGKSIIFNICVLGALAGLTGLIKSASMLAAICRDHLHTPVSEISSGTLPGRLHSRRSLQRSPEYLD